MQHSKNRPSFDEIYMKLAELVAQRSTCSRLNVGCVITDGDKLRVLSIGYNGNYRGGPNNCDSTEPGKCGCLHAEDNAALKLDFTEPTKIAYVTHLPCIMCAKRLINTGVQQIYYRNDYRIKDSLDICKQAGVRIEQI